MCSCPQWVWAVCTGEPSLVPHSNQYKLDGALIGTFPFFSSQPAWTQHTFERKWKASKGLWREFMVTQSPLGVSSAVTPYQDQLSPLPVTSACPKSPWIEWWPGAPSSNVAWSFLWIPTQSITVWFWLHVHWCCVVLALFYWYVDLRGSKAGQLFFKTFLMSCITSCMFKCSYLLYSVRLTLSGRDGFDVYKYRVSSGEAVSGNWGHEFINKLFPRGVQSVTRQCHWWQCYLAKWCEWIPSSGK